jgi:hypothetical protein
MRFYRGILVAGLLATTVGTTPAVAQTASRLGPSMTAIPTYVRGSSVAYDYKTGVYLVVSAYGNLNGVFVTADGAVGASFTINGPFSHFPSVAYSPDINGGAGGFLVTWHLSVGNGAIVHGKIVTSTGVVGPDIPISLSGSWWEAAADVAYSTTSREFLVVWQGIGIVGQRVGLNGELLGTNFNINPPIHGRDPAVVYNPTTNEFMVSFGDIDVTSDFAAAQRVKAGTGALVGPEIVVGRALQVYITEIAYNASTNQYLVSWYQGGTYGRLLDASGTPTTGVVLVGISVSAYDALGIDYNASAGSFMMVSHLGSSYQDGAVELNGTTAAPDVAIVATSVAATKGNFYPKVASAVGRSEWLMSTATDFAATTVQRLQSTRTGGGGVPSPPPPPPPPNPRAAATAAKADFSSDFKADIVWQRDDGYLSVWAMNGTTATAGTLLTPATVDPNWRIVATGDLNGDGKADLVWEHTNGWLAVWFMNGPTMASSAFLNPVSVDANWRIVGAGDFNGDGKADLVWQHTDGWLALWYMNGATMLSSQYLNPSQIASDWKVMGVGDFNGDSSPDLVWQHANGSIWVWYMNGPNAVGSAVPSPGRVENLGWRVRAVVDLNGDGQTDLIWQNMAEGWLCAWLMNGVTATNGVFLNPASVSGGWKIMGPR